ncbi:hypothetical protein F7725_015093 [Dissostichus mawsoni]|uniref:Uncharacterized protein n=1 Tax=Dissostichus mawsoni TaxID=36200 RepID=A0A7J5YGI1_DISMA|nr:hypothetical protein F7725_015093 [Dissostichus mawsoni]
MSCTSITYYSTTNSVSPHAPHQTTPSYATLIQTVSHCNIPLQNACLTGITPYSSPVPKLRSCTSPPLVKTIRGATDFHLLPPPPPPYTPRKTGNDSPCATATRTPMLRTDSKAGKKDKEVEKEKKEDLPQLSQAQLGVLHKMLCSGPNARPGTPNRALPQNCSEEEVVLLLGPTTAGPLTSTQAETLRQVQEILGGLVSGARCKLDPAKVAEKLLGPNGPLHDIRSLQTQLQSLEGVLETSQNTIKVLLDVIKTLRRRKPRETAVCVTL